MKNPEELRDFLMTRRARITPEQVGLVSHGTRRVPGLRREEVAMAAGVSTDYYVRLEKGKVVNPSDSVLDAVSRVLELDEAEHVHLYDLVRATCRRTGATARTRPGGPVPRPSLQWMVDSMTDAVAVVGNPYLGITAMNHLARAMFSPMLDTVTDGRANFSRFAFLEPAARDFYADWESAARTCVALLRMALGRQPHQRDLQALVGELSTHSAEFRTMWAAHEVRLHHSGTKAFNHPEVGVVELMYHSVELPSDPGHTLTIYNAIPGTPTADALRLLSSWAASQTQEQRAGGGADGAATTPTV